MRTLKLLLCTLTLIASSTITASAEWISLDQSDTQSYLLVENADPTGLRIRLHFPGFETHPLRLLNRDFTRLEFEGSGAWGQLGSPELPILRKMVQLPEREGWQYEIIDIDYIELSGYHIAPLQEGTVETPDGPFEPEIHFDERAYTQDRWLPESPVGLNRPVIMGSIRLGSLELRPIQYNPAREKLRIYRSITVEITFAGEGENPILRTRRQPSQVFSQLVRSSVLNPQAFNTEDEVLGGYLIITPPSYENNSYLQQFVEWKRQKGLPCTVVNTNTTGGSATSIKTYIQNNVYNVWPIPPDFLVLVGDNDQGMPTHTYSGSGNATDLTYTLMEGTAYFPDMLAGRLSIDNDTQLSIVCSKSIMYEKTPYMAETNWFERGLMVYDYGGSLSCKNVKERCAHLMEEHNSAATIVHVTAPPNYSGGALINSNVNTGVIFVNYRGYGSYSSWTPPSYSISNMGGLNNGQKLPIITSIVCGGGNFVSSTDPCLGENWIRLGSGPLDVKGAVAFMGPTSLYTHTKWNNCIDGGIYQGVFKEDVRDVASALTRGKMELYYGMPNNQGSGGTTNSVECYFHIYNVLGDPGLQIWTKIPNILTVTHESALPLGVNYFEVNVQGPTGPVEDAVVCVYNQTHEYQEVLWTDESGNVLFDLEDAPAATYSVTVTGKNLKPHLGTLTISQESVALGISNFSVDDDMIGESSGDGDGHVNPGETIELVVTLENTGSSQTATSISGIASSADPHVNVTENTQTGPDAPPGTTSLLNDDFNLVISSEAPHSHVVPLTLFAVSSQGNWTNLINLEIIAPLAEATEYEVQNAAGYINPGELADVTVTLQNSGGDPLTDCSATL
ncbi:MAG: C25 family cysteine peptidase, partial [Planctomycetota bacterium]